MIREDLLEFKYYLDRLSMFMKQSYGIIEQTDIFYQQLKVVNECFDEFFENIDVWNRNAIYTEMLDNIGHIFGCYRNFTIKLNDTYEEINLNNNDYLIYIKCQIVKQNFNGSREELLKLYKTYENGRVTEGSILDLVFVYILNQDIQLNTFTCNIFWCNYEEFNSQNLHDLFSAGYLTIESMGIEYNRILQNIDNLAMFGNLGVDPSLNDYYFDGTNYYQWDGSAWTNVGTSKPSVGRNIQFMMFSNIDGSFVGGIFN